MNKNFLLAIAVILGIGLVMAAGFKAHQPVVQPPQYPQYPQVPVVPPSVNPQPIPPIVQPPNITPRNYREAVALAKRQNKQLFLYFGASWCPHCVRMKQTLNDASVKTALNKYVVYEVNTDSERSVVSKYNVTSIPAYAIVSNNEQTIKSETGYKNPRDFKRWLGSVGPWIRPNRPSPG